MISINYILNIFILKIYLYTFVKNILHLFSVECCSGKEHAKLTNNNKNKKIVSRAHTWTNRYRDVLLNIDTMRFASWMLCRDAEWGFYYLHTSFQNPLLPNYSTLPYLFLNFSSFPQSPFFSFLLFLVLNLFLNTNYLHCILPFYSYKFPKLSQNRYFILFRFKPNLHQFRGEYSYGPGNLDRAQLLPCYFTLTHYLFTFPM